MLHTPLLLLALVFISSAAASVTLASKKSAGAAYFMIDDPDQNLVSVPIASDGTLVSIQGLLVRVFSVGGTGLWAPHVGIPGIPAVLFAPGPDPLFTQGSVQVHQEAGILVTVNPGSNTLALFSINLEDLTQLTPIGKPVASRGEFPNLVAINSKATTVCVLNGGGVNGVNCYTPHSTIGLIPKPNTLRLLNVNQTQPPTGPLGTLSTIVFSPDNSKVIVTVKAAGGNLNAFVAMWTVESDGSLSKDFVKSIEGDNLGCTPFTLLSIPGTNAFLANPTIGYATWNFRNSKSLQATAVSFPIPNQVINCWTAYSSKSGNFYVIDPGASIVSEVHFDEKLNGTIVKQYPQELNSDTLDSTVAIVDNHVYLYMLEPNATSIGVLSVDKSGSAPTMQMFNMVMALKEAGLTTWENLNFQGMQTFISN